MTSRAQLQTSVDAWLARDDVAVSGPDFDQILLIAESQISMAYRFAIQETATDLVFTGQSIDLPADYLEPRNPFIDDSIRKFEFKLPHVLRQSAGWSTGRVGQAYTLEGSETAVSPDDRVQMTIAGPATAADPLTIKIYYYARLAALVNGIDTNWVIINHFDVYLYETLRTAAEYIHEMELEAKYAANVKINRDQFSKHENRKRYGAMAKQAYGNPRTVV
jgi:hypothetical protein